MNKTIIKLDKDSVVISPEYLEFLQSLEPKEKPQKITMRSIVEYRNGTKPRKLLCVDASGVYPVVTLTERGVVEKHTAIGRYNSSGGEHNLDLIIIGEKPMFEEGEKILVSDDGVSWYKRKYIKTHKDGTFEACNGSGAQATWLRAMKIGEIVGGGE